MAYAGQTLHNPVSGEQIDFLRTAADTDGALLEFEVSSRPTATCPVLTCTPSRRSASTCSRAR